MNRSVAAVQARAEQLRLPARVRDGYSAADLARLLGIQVTTVQRWLRGGMFGRVCGEVVKEPDVLRFVRKYPGQVDLCRVDQIWFKGLIFGGEQCL